MSSPYHSLKREDLQFTYPPKPLDLDMPDLHDTPSV